MLLRYGSRRNILVHLGGYSTHRDVADISNLFYFYSVFIWSMGMTRLPRSRLWKRNGMNKIQYKHFRQSVQTKVMKMRMYQFKSTKTLFLQRGYEQVLSLTRWNRLYIDTKILLSETPVEIFFRYKHPATMSP